MVICDTEALTTMLWSDLLYGGCSDELRHGAEARCKNYARYLLCDIDLPFTPDPQRCFPAVADRERCWRLWREALISRRRPFVKISGGWAEREKGAIDAVEKLMADQRCD